MKIDIKLIPIKQEADPETEKYLTDDFSKGVYEACTQYYDTIGYHFPWVCYLILQNDQVVGTAGFKGAPKEDQVEIAYGTHPDHEGKGISTQSCYMLRTIARTVDPKLKITARTLMEQNASTRILTKNGFDFTGVVTDPDDGDVWEWVYQD